MNKDLIIQFLQEQLQHQSKFIADQAIIINQLEARIAFLENNQKKIAATAASHRVVINRSPIRSIAGSIAQIKSAVFLSKPPITYFHRYRSSLVWSSVVASSKAA